VELKDLLAARRMTRSFDGTPVPVDWLEEICALALWAPTAGNAAGVRCHVIDAEHVGGFFDVATDAQWREGARRYPGLRRAGAVVLVTSRPADYVARYGEPDKASSGLEEIDAWPLPYWHTDAAMATMALLLLLEDALRAWADLGEEELFVSVIIGRPDEGDVRSNSLRRPVPSRAERVRRVV
jgi:nitroreductase